MVTGAGGQSGQIKKLVFFMQRHNTGSSTEKDLKCRLKAEIARENI